MASNNSQPPTTSWTFSTAISLIKITQLQHSDTDPEYWLLEASKGELIKQSIVAMVDNTPNSRQEEARTVALTSIDMMENIEVMLRWSIKTCLEERKRIMEDHGES